MCCTSLKTSINTSMKSFYSNGRVNIIIAYSNVTTANDLINLNVKFND